MELNSAKTCSKVVTNLFIATQQRDTDMDKLFQYEVSLPPPAFLSEAEVNMCKAKSTLMGCLIDENIDLPIKVQQYWLTDPLLHKCVETIGAYIKQTYLNMILRHLLVHERVDLLFDRYFDLRIKGVTRVRYSALKKIEL